MAQIVDILEFQVERRIFYICKKSLEELEKIKNYSLILEKIMENAGFIDEEYKKSEEIFRAGRKIILDEVNNGNRELQDLMKQFDIKLKG